MAFQKLNEDHFPILFKNLRGPIAKEVYRYTKGVIITGSIAKPFGYAVLQIPTELSKGYVHSTISDIGENIIGYISGVGFVRYIYKIAQPGKLKQMARLIYNVGCLPITLYAKGICAAFDLLQLSKLEKLWFGEVVYPLSDNRSWIERNFTMTDVMDSLE